MGHGYTVFFEDLFGLVFVNIHRQTVGTDLRVGPQRAALISTDESLCQAWGSAKKNIDLLYKNLYSKFVFDLTSIFSSKAKLKVLRTLCCQSAPLPLRHIAYLSDTPVFSIQRAVKQLVAQKILIKKRKKPYTYYSLNSNNMFYPFLTQVFDLEIKNRITFLSADYAQKAKRSLDFASSATRFFDGL